METVKIYLSGAMGSLSFDEQNKWRQQIQDSIKYEYDCEKKPIFFNPVDYYNFVDIHYKTDKEVMEYDLHNLRNSNLMIVNFNDPASLGTAMEVALAYELRMPIIGLNKDNQVLHSWLKCSCNRIFTNLRELVDYVVEFYLK